MKRLEAIPIEAATQAEIVARELKRATALAAQKLEEAREDTKNQVISEQTVEKQIVKSTE